MPSHYGKKAHKSKAKKKKSMFKFGKKRKKK
jgi:hypothetical protein